MSDSAQLSPVFTEIPQINPLVYQNRKNYRDAFLQAAPFKHAVIDNFFTEEFAQRLLRDFPVFDPALAKNELGVVAKKAVNTNIREISETYRELYRIIDSEPFLNFVGELSNIPHLVADVKMYGGGTHENLDGQSLDPHVDFNYDETRQLHRRLNLIVYLNPGWQIEWGGGLEIHSDPRDWKTNEVRTYNPIFNRCILFETNEVSWHGFPKIKLPENQRHLSRKSISIYLYTKDRPQEEIAPWHGTFYVHRLMPEHLKPGHTLTEEDVEDLGLLLTNRDNWIRRYERLELDKNRELTDKQNYINEILGKVRAPLTGYVLQEGGSTGLYADGWAASSASFTIRAQQPVKRLTIIGWRPDQTTVTIGARVHDLPEVEITTGEGLFHLVYDVDPPLTDTFQLLLRCSERSHNSPEDSRDLAFVLVEVRVEH